MNKETIVGFLNRQAETSRRYAADARKRAQEMQQSAAEELAAADAYEAKGLEFDRAARLCEAAK
jgi:hypothetical protein